MASLRGGQYLWGSADGAGTVEDDDVTELAIAGPGPYVAIYIETDTDITFDVEASATASPKAGRNALNNDPDGGLDWFPYSGAQGLAVSSGDKLCFDLAPYSPQFLRLHRTDANGEAHITAIVSSFGVE
jgi:hypothetical protein